MGDPMNSGDLTGSTGVISIFTETPPSGDRYRRNGSPSPYCGAALQKFWTFSGGPLPGRSVGEQLVTHRARSGQVRQLLQMCSLDSAAQAGVGRTGSGTQHGAVIAR